MTSYDGPILDNHFHVQPGRGRFLEAVRDFENAGGTHITHIPIPGQTDKLTRPAWRRFFEDHLETSDRIEAETGVRVLRALGPYPIEYVRMRKTIGAQAAQEAMRAGYDAAFELLAEKRAVAMGEIGRPHFDVDPEVMRESNDLLVYGLGRARDADVAAILHTEHGSPPVFEDLARLAAKAAFPLDRLVKHYAPAALLPEENHGLFPSIIASKTNVAEAVAKGDAFLMETDYIDDPDRPNVVLPPYQVPKRTKAMLAQGVQSSTLHRIHQEHPARIYRVRLEPGKTVT